MGWGRTLLFGDIGNRLDIGACEQEISALRRQLNRKSHVDRDQNDELKRLRQEVDQLKLCVGSLASILTANGIVDQAELARFAQLIDDHDVDEFTGVQT